MRKVSKKKWAVFGIAMAILVADLVFLLTTNRIHDAQVPSRDLSKIVSGAPVSGVGDDYISQLRLATETAKSSREKYSAYRVLGNALELDGKYEQAVDVFGDALSVSGDAGIDKTVQQELRNKIEQLKQAVVEKSSPQSDKPEWKGEPE